MPEVENILVHFQLLDYWIQMSFLSLYLKSTRTVVMSSDCFHYDYYRNISYIQGVIAKIPVQRKKFPEPLAREQISLETVFLV